MSLDYLKTRKQFGRAIGSFQALQHRAATLHVAVASSGAFLFEAAIGIEGSHRSRACAAARARAPDCALTVVKEAVQFHGMIGFAEEFDLGLYFRRAVALSTWYGNAACWRRRILGVWSWRVAGCLLVDRIFGLPLPDQLRGRNELRHIVGNGSAPELNEADTGIGERKSINAAQPARYLSSPSIARRY
jgi:hypothetical protein